jgi:hypothetical protein
MVNAFGGGWGFGFKVKDIALAEDLVFWNKSCFGLSSIRLQFSR